MKKNILIIVLILIVCLISFSFYNKKSTELSNVYYRNITEYYDILRFANKSAQNRAEKDIQYLIKAMEKLKLIGGTTLVELEPCFSEIPDYIHRKLKYYEDSFNEESYALACEEIETFFEFFNDEIIYVDNNNSMIINYKYNKDDLFNIRTGIIQNYRSLK